jgi:hypothetical protein
LVPNAIMNNQSFRDLLKKDAQTSDASSTALGAKRSSKVPMTPRPGPASSSSTDFARQVRERHAGLQPTKKFKSSVPMGSKMAEGYTDRAKLRAEAEKRDREEKTARVKALEEQVRLGSLSRHDFELLSEKIMDGEASSKAPVRGLNKDLLARARRGEDELQSGPEQDAVHSDVDVDAELDKLGDVSAAAPERVKREKAGIRANTQIAGLKRTRDEIMADLKAKRQAIAKERAKDKPTFDNRWRKVGEQAKPRIEIDKKGREVIITVDEDGIVKRMVRKKQDATHVESTGIVDKTKPVLGADFIVPDPAPVSAMKDGDSDDDDDIFAGVGAEYNPLGVEDDDDDDDDNDASNLNDAPSTAQQRLTLHQEVEPKASPTSHEETQPVGQPNYFGNSTKRPEESEAPRHEMIVNIIKKAANVGLAQQVEQTIEEKIRDERRAKLLARDRDLDDMDLGFGGSKFDDFEDGEENGKARLSEWKQSGADDGDGKRHRDDTARKRKPKKRKGDVNNMDDIMRVLEGRRAAKPK